MASTNQTTHYNLPVYSGSDIASWTDTNTPFADIDSAIYTAAQTAASAASDVSNLSGTVSNHTTSISDINTDISALQLADTNMDTRVGTIETTVGGHTTSIATNASNISSNANAISDIEEDITDVESTNHASKAYAVGDTLIYDHDLYEVTAAISIGDTLAIGTNIVKTNIETLFQDLVRPQYISLTAAAGATITHNETYKIGKLVVVNIYVHLTQNVPVETNFVTGLPKGSAIYATGDVITGLHSNRLSVRNNIDGLSIIQGTTDASIQSLYTDMNVSSLAGYFSLSGVYIAE